MTQNELRKERKNENRSVDRADPARADGFCVRAKWFPAIPADGTNANRFGRAVYGRIVPIALLLGGRRAASYWRCVAAHKSVRTSRSRTAWTSDCEHTLVPLAIVPERFCGADRRDGIVVHRFLCASPPLLGDFRAARLVGHRSKSRIMGVGTQLPTLVT